MTMRDDYRHIGDLVLLCAQTMRMLSAEKRKQGVDCPFKPTTYELERLSREIKAIAAGLSSEWDRDKGVDLHS